MTIVRDCGRELALAAASVVRALALAGPTPCGLAGGVLVGGQRVRTAFTQSLAEFGVWIEPIQSVAEPALGAILLARGLLTGRNTGSRHPD